MDRIRPFWRHVVKDRPILLTYTATVASACLVVLLFLATGSLPR